MFLQKTAKKRSWNDEPGRALSLKTKMVALIALLITAVLLVIGLFSNYFVRTVTEDQLGEQALSVAEAIALNPDIIEAFDAPDPAAVIQPLVTPVQQATEAEFIVVGNREEIRYSHPNPEQIGGRMVGEDNERALNEGQSYVSKAAGTLGDSLRAKVPIYSDGQIIGVVSVGFLSTDVQSLIGDYTQEVWLMLLIIGAVAFLMAIAIASYIKRKLHGLEPEEIAHLLFQKETILQSTHEGIIAVNRLGHITLLNHQAKQLLFGNEKDEQSLIGQPVTEVLPSSDLPEILASGTSHFDQERLYGEHPVYVNSSPIHFEGALVGAVSTFRYKTEIDQLAKELAQVKQYANALRAQTHEFSNKLYTISGLLHLDKRKDALEFIRTEHHIQLEWSRQLIGKVKDPLISGLLLGKIHQAREQQVQLTIGEDSSLQQAVAEPQRQALLTAIGNLLDNAFEAVKQQPISERLISLTFTDIGDDIIFEIDDSGPGISPAIASGIFNEGTSSKSTAGRGFGLSTTNRLAKAAGGEVLIEESELGGACFVLTLPKEGIHP
ncbi:MAG: sensor histidine kinase [Planococcus citreus]